MGQTPLHFQIEFNCPQCGAPACLEETDRLFRCDHCRVKSYLLAEDHFRYLIPCDSAGGKPLVYYPYWYFKGMFFVCMGNHVESKYLDVSFQGIETEHFPPSVGLRSQALKLRFLTPDTKGRFLKPVIGLPEIVENVRKRFLLGKTEPVFHTEFIGETISLIYSPFHLGEYVYDALENRPVCELPPDDPKLERFPNAEKWRIRFMPTLCPHCGWDLDGERESLILHCGHCRNLWQTKAGKLEKIPFRSIAGDYEGNAWLPFWRIKAETSGIGLDTHQEMLNIARVPRIGNEKSDDDRPFYFWIPAFKMWPERFLPLAVKATLGQPDVVADSEGAFSGGEILPANLPIAEAAQVLTSILVSASQPVKFVTDRLENIRIRPRKYLLVHVPFKTTHHEYIQPELKLAVHKNVFKLAEKL